MSRNFPPNDCYLKLNLIYTSAFLFFQPPTGSDLGNFSYSLDSSGVEKNAIPTVIPVQTGI